MNQLKAAATPMRKLNHYERAASNSPKTPRPPNARGKDNIVDEGLAVVAGSSMTPMKRVPILANFEEWMKMATDNKINATNSWNFALIDYFHDMSLLKEGDGVNFQKASCTLDGCVKIYTSRVDSVATETGKLLSGLADSGSKKTKRGEEEGEDGEDGEEEEEGEDGARKKAKKRVFHGRNHFWREPQLIYYRRNALQKQPLLRLLRHCNSRSLSSNFQSIPFSRKLQQTLMKAGRKGCY